MATSKAKQKLREERKAKGLCIHCGATAKTGETRCERCATKGNKSNKAAYEKRKILGLCASGCGNPAEENSVYCEDCLVEARLKDSERYRERAKHGQCVDCAKPATHGLRCEAHAAKSREFLRSLYDTRVASKLCTRCGAQVTSVNAKRCAACLAESRNLHRERKLRVMEAYGGAVCVGCGETELEVLQLDHINGGGDQHAKVIGDGDRAKGRAKMYQYVESTDYPEGFRVLCANCNIRAARGLGFPNEHKEVD